MSSLEDFSKGNSPPNQSIKAQFVATEVLLFELSYKHYIIIKHKTDQVLALPNDTQEITWHLFNSKQTQL